MAKAKKSKVVSDSDESFGDDSDAPTARRAIKSVPAHDPSNPVVELVLAHRPVGSDRLAFPLEEVSLNAGYEFLVKWVGLSHLHCSWIPSSGERRIANYVRSFNDRGPGSLSREDAEELFQEQSLAEELLLQHQTVERVVALRGSDRFFIKWVGLGYDACTWETFDCLQRVPSALAAIDAFQQRSQHRHAPHRGAGDFSRAGARPAFIPIAATDAALQGVPDRVQGAVLRDYQVDGVNWIAFAWSNRRNVILADEMGLGKTLQSACFLSWLIQVPKVYGPFLIVVPLSTVGAWQRELGRWLPAYTNTITLLGNALSRSIIREFELFTAGGARQPAFNVLLTTPEVCMRESSLLSQFSWASLVVDEAHRLKNCSSHLYKILFALKTAHCLLVTGTPLQNSVRELWCLLRFLEPEQYSDSGENSLALFEERFSRIHQEHQVEALHALLRPHLLRRQKRDVERSLPGRVERILRVPLTHAQSSLYRLILTRNYHELSKGLAGRQASLMNIVIELKKVANHLLCWNYSHSSGDCCESFGLQQLLESSGKMQLLHELLQRLRKDGHRVLIFSQMIRMLDLLGVYLSLQGYSFQRLDGSIDSESRKRAIERFNAPGSEDFCFLLSTRAGGLGINLETADTVIIFDSDWNPQNDLQAMARAHRIGQRNIVAIYRLVSRDTIEEEILERAKRKMILDHVVIQRLEQHKESPQPELTAPREAPFSRADLQSILQFGAQRLFQSEGSELASVESLDLDQILERAAEEPSGDGSSLPPDSFLDRFQTADFGLMEWKEIIPEGILQEQAKKEVVEKEEARNVELVRRQEKKEAARRAIRRQQSTVEVELLPQEKWTESLLKEAIKVALTFGSERSGGEFSLLFDRLSSIGQGASIAVINQSVRVNISTFQRRSQQLNRLNEIIGRCYGGKASASSFRIPWLPKAVKRLGKWSDSWSVRDDSVLLFLCWKHGYGNLPNALKSEKSVRFPGDQPLDRLKHRTDSLLNAVCSYQEEPAPASLQSSGVVARAKFNARKFLMPVRRYLQELEKLEDPNVEVIRNCLLHIGGRICEQTVPKLRDKLWDFVVLCWPSDDAKGKDLLDLYEKIIAANV